MIISRHKNEEFEVTIVLVVDVVDQSLTFLNFKMLSNGAFKITF